MYTDTEGIVFKQVKTVGERRMVLLFCKKFGKISAGTSINEKGRGKSALAMRPFTYGRYEIYKNRDNYNVNGAEVLKSYYRIGEDVEKYMSCSYVLEFTEKLLPEDMPSPQLFSLLLEFFSVMEDRKKQYETMVLAYEVKALQIHGSMPHLDSCINCGSLENLAHFSVEDGGLLCQACCEKKQRAGDFTKNTFDGLIYTINFVIVDILRYFLKHSLSSFKNLALEPEVQRQIAKILKAYMGYHLEIGELKSEGFFENS